MTYDPTSDDPAHGLLVQNAPDDSSPIGQITRRLDDLIQRLTSGPPPDATGVEALRGECRALVWVLAVLTCYDEQSIKNQLMVRHERLRLSS